MKDNTQYTTRIASWMICFVLGTCLWLGSGCIPKGEKGEVLAPKGQLVFRARTFNRFLRWKAFDRAKMLVAPKKRAAFMLDWERKRPNIRITDFRVRDVTEIKKGREAIVLVVIHRHQLPSVSVRRVLEQQRWKSEGGFWFFEGVKEPDPKDKKPTKTPAKKPTKTPAKKPAKAPAKPATRKAG